MNVNINFCPIKQQHFHLYQKRSPKQQCSFTGYMEYFGQFTTLNLDCNLNFVLHISYDDSLVNTNTTKNLFSSLK